METRKNLYREHIYKKAISFGESLMPHDLADIINKADRGGKYKDFFYKGFENVCARYEFFIEIYESCGFTFPEDTKDFTLCNYQIYF